MTGSLLADWGAEVIKIEHPGSGDFVRKFGAQKKGEGLYWVTLSRNKKSVALDLHDSNHQSIIRKSISKFDILIENFRPGTLEKWNLAPNDLLKIAPHLVVLRVTAFGQEGPYKDRPGFGTLAEAMSGLASISGFENQPPLLPPVALADVMAGYLGAASALAAVYKAKQTGIGEVIDLAIYEAVMKLMELQIIEYDQNGTLHKRNGNRMEDTAPRGAYQCKDGLWIALSGSTQPIAERVLRTIGGEELVNDPRFINNQERVKHVEELDSYISEWCSKRTREEAINELLKSQAAVGPVEDVSTLLNNPQVKARQSIITTKHPVLGNVKMLNIIPRFLHSPSVEIKPAPSKVGQDTLDILKNDLLK
jgi:crotonobetainyl-CoA:carnitine CoA-transferase CaiB-like acyl-CoA transferase